MRDLRDAKPGEVYRDRDGDVWGVLSCGHANKLMFVDGERNNGSPKWKLDDPWLADCGPFFLLTPEEDTEW